MNLQDFKFKEVSQLDMTFSTLQPDKALLEEAKARGFYNGKTAYNKLFSTIFFLGGKVVFKNDVPEKFVSRAWPYCKCLMKSFQPKHEEKEAICAMIMSEILEPNIAK